MIQEELRRVVAAAMACECCRAMEPGTWVDLAAWLLTREEWGAEIEEVVELACLPDQAARSQTAPIVERLIERCGIPIPDSQAAVETLTRLLAEDLRAAPVPVAFPMIRMLGELAAWDLDSGLLETCALHAEYLDCLCRPQVGAESLEHRLQALPAIGLHREAATILARTSRAGLPTAQLRCGRGG
ncbi:hypothetical protein [Actinomyces bowdenii]|uniref:Uncharacterized protein n=1 Tax=Actinomyces bowdenii TaxID=131109 RepID=A0A853EIA6_9ACTO|nr:hypothetical protein [Actinomyces bowdenii]MBF0696826.1 hypothetical protein [Actinomyces bowdenii]NYS68999.1 hypothetical protein [Actinomyces bowdenii]